MAGVDYISPSVIASDSTTSAGNGVALAVVTAPEPGSYELEIKIELTGTAETALRNIKLRVNSVQVGANLPTLSAQVLSFKIPRVEVAAGNIDLFTAAAAVVGSIYNTQIVATRIK